MQKIKLFKCYTEKDQIYWADLSLLGQEPTFKGLLHCFLTCIESTGTNWYYFNLKNVENCKEKFQRVKKL